MKNLQVVIGIEVHVALNTKTKMFSDAENSRYNEPNTSIALLDLGVLGTMPTVNKQAIIKGMVLASSLQMKIASVIQFDRKNYFYIDLPKNFQITQQFRPIGKNGFLEINVNNTIKKIAIERIHLEEDTAKKIEKDNKIYLDYNRAGCPLIEIVTKPDIRSSAEAVEYLKELRRILVFNNISDAKMEDGSMRADINISLNPIGSLKYGNKVEIKNVNSITNVAKAIEFEIKRQTNLILTNQEVEQQTRKFNDKNNTTEYMRSKSNAVDYRYITEPNILSFKTPKTLFEDDSLKNVIYLRQLKDKLCKELPLKDVENLLDNYDWFEIFNSVNDKINNFKLTYNWIMIELVGILKKLSLTSKSIDLTIIENIVILLTKIQDSSINSKQAKTLLLELIQTKKSVLNLIKELGFVQITDKKVIGDILDKYISDNTELLKEYPTRPERVIKFFIGMVMKETKAQANPNITLEILKEKLA